jgi:drug/metabolite transporter (DMT)-like permease
MNARAWDYGYVFLTVALTVYGQLVLKWRIADFGAMPPGFREKIVWLVTLCFEPWIFSGFVAAFLASLAWMAALTRFELSYAYPFTSLSFVLVLVLSVWMLGESLNAYKVLGVALIVAGTIVASRA